MKSIIDEEEINSSTSKRTNGREKALESQAKLLFSLHCLHQAHPQHHLLARMLLCQAQLQDSVMHLFLVLLPRPRKRQFAFLQHQPSGLVHPGSGQERFLLSILGLEMNHQNS